ARARRADNRAVDRQRSGLAITDRARARRADRRGGRAVHLARAPPRSAAARSGVVSQPAVRMGNRSAGAQLSRLLRSLVPAAGLLRAHAWVCRAANGPAVDTV